MIQQLTLAEEVNLIIQDAFQGDKTAEKTCLKKLAEVHSKTFSKMSEEELQELILEQEDQLYYLFELYSVGEL